jgi:hypothetical protein
MNISSFSPANDFTQYQKKQNDSYAIIGRASDNPLYVDPETGDNVLHALSRIRRTPSSSLVDEIEGFIAKDADINLHNYQRDCPLASFIQERPIYGSRK